MDRIAKRSFLIGTSAAFIVAATLTSTKSLAASGQFAGDPETIGQWMDAWMLPQKKADGSLWVGRFADPIYFLLQPIKWSPNPGEDDVYPVAVPKGFITDFASIPQVFWSLLKPDGNYAWAAVVHDYLYWTQTTSRDVADKTLLYAMDDFPSISAITKRTIYEAVHLFGGGAWDENARLKAQGERRTLRESPTDPTTTWEQWKVKPEHFESPIK